MQRAMGNARVKYGTPTFVWPALAGFLARSGLDGGAIGSDGYELHCLVWGISR